MRRSTTVGCSAAMRCSTTMRRSAAVRLSAAMGCSTTVRPAMRFATVRSTTAARSTVGVSAVRSTVAAIIVAVSIMAVLGLPAAASVIAAAALTMEAMVAPTMAVTPAGPWAYAEKDAVVEIPRSVKAIGRASVRRSFIIAPLTDGWDADFDGNLRFRCRHNGQSSKHYCRSE